MHDKEPRTTETPPLQRFLPLVFLSLNCLSGASGTLQAADLAVDWFSIDGGGGASAGGAFTAVGTIGQPDAGTASGGEFTLVGGIQSFGTARMISTPSLSIYRANGSVVISWPASSVGFLLEQAFDLRTGSWSDVPNTPEESDGRKRVTVNAPSGTRFYRLRK